MAVPAPAYVVGIRDYEEFDCVHIREYTATYAHVLDSGVLEVHFDDGLEQYYAPHAWAYLKKLRD